MASIKIMGQANEVLNLWRTTPENSKDNLFCRVYNGAREAES